MKHKRIIAIVAGILFLITGCGTEGKNNEKIWMGSRQKRKKRKKVLMVLIQKGQ